MDDMPETTRADRASQRPALCLRGPEDKGQDQKGSRINKRCARYRKRIGYRKVSELLIKASKCMAQPKGSTTPSKELGAPTRLRHQC